MERRGVLITRPAVEAATTARHVQDRGFVPVLAPLLAVELRPFTWESPVAAILFTSGNAVQAMGGQADIPVFAVGDATAARARLAGFRHVISAAGTASDLISLVRTHCPSGATLLLISGAGRGLDVSGSLRDAGFRVWRRVGYAVHPVRQLPEPAHIALRESALRAALFLSAETARVFIRVLPAEFRGSLSGIDALAIGQLAAEVLAPLPWRQVRVSLGPTLEQVLALL